MPVQIPSGLVGQTQPTLRHFVAAPVYRVIVRDVPRDPSALDYGVIGWNHLEHRFNSHIIHLTHYPSHTISISHNIHLTHYPSHTISISAQLVISAIGYKNIMQHLFSTHLQLYSSLCPVAMEQRLVPYHDWFGNIFFLTHRGRFACEAICMLRKSCSARDYMIWFALYFKDTTITVILVFISLDFIIHPAHILGIHSILVKFF